MGSATLYATIQSVKGCEDVDYILDGVASMLNTMSVVLGGWSIAADLGEKVAAITPHMQKANKFVPISGAMHVFASWIALQMLLAAYYWITRTINLIRGAG